MTVAHFILIYLNHKNSPSPIHCFHQLKLCVSEDEALYLCNAQTFAVSCNANGWSWRSGTCATCRHASRQLQVDNLLFNKGNIRGYAVMGLNGCAESIGKDFRIVLLHFERCWKRVYHTWFCIALCGRSWRSEGGVEPFNGCGPRYLRIVWPSMWWGWVFSSVADVCRWAGSWGELTYWCGRCGPVWCICLRDRMKLNRGVLLSIYDLHDPRCSMAQLAYPFWDCMWPVVSSSPVCWAVLSCGISQQ